MGPGPVAHAEHRTSRRKFLGLKKGRGNVSRRIPEPPVTCRPTISWSSARCSAGQAIGEQRCCQNWFGSGVFEQQPGSRGRNEDR